MNTAAIDLHSTFQTKPVILYYGFCTTVIAIHPSLCVLELGRHGLVLDCSFEVSKLHFHVHHASTTYRASIRVLHVLVVTEMMNTVATGHEHDSLGRSEHVFATYGAVTIG